MDINEPVIKKFHPHFLGYLVFYISGVIIFILGYFLYWPLCLIGLLTIALGEVARRAETFYLLESGVTREYKLLSTSRDFVEYEKIQNIKVRQSFLENILGIGNLHMDTSGGDKTELNFRGVVDPYGVEHIIREKMKLV